MKTKSGAGKSKKGFITINRELCKGCKFCILACPNGVLEFDKDLNSQGFFPAMPTRVENCTGCALCAQMCPEVAIEVWVEGV
ncbi:MAG: ferredoxin family protein [Nitrospiraceae bacterium]|nr:ferredoxin family protein [Nitrospiraceae bacterium]